MELNKKDKILENEYLKEKILHIEKLVKQNEYKTAYLKLASILEYINIKFIIKSLGINIKNYDIIKISSIYQKKDEFLFEQMVSVNAEYNIIDIENVDISDIEYLYIKINYIYKYMINKYGKFI